MRNGQPSPEPDIHMVVMPAGVFNAIAEETECYRRALEKLRDFRADQGLPSWAREIVDEALLCE